MKFIKVTEVLYPDSPIYLNVDTIVSIKDKKNEHGYVEVPRGSKVLIEDAPPTSYISTTQGMHYVVGGAEDLVEALTTSPPG